MTLMVRDEYKVCMSPYVGVSNPLIHYMPLILYIFSNQFKDVLLINHKYSCILGRYYCMLLCDKVMSEKVNNSI